MWLMECSPAIIFESISKFKSSVEGRTRTYTSVYDLTEELISFMASGATESRHKVHGLFTSGTAGNNVQ